MSNQFKNLEYLSLMLQPIIEEAIKDGIAENKYWSPQYLEESQEQVYIEKSLRKYGEKLLKLIEE